MNTYTVGSFRDAIAPLSRTEKVALATAVVGATGVLVTVGGVYTYAMASLGEAICDGVVGIFAG